VPDFFAAISLSITATLKPRCRIIEGSAILLVAASDASLSQRRLLNEGLRFWHAPFAMHTEGICGSTSVPQLPSTARSCTSRENPVWSPRSYVVLIINESGFSSVTIIPSTTGHWLLAEAVRFRAAANLSLHRDRESGRRYH